MLPFFLAFFSRALRRLSESRSDDASMAPRGSVVAVVAGAASGTKHICGICQQPFARARRLLVVLARNERSTRVPETLPCPRLAVQSEQADLGERSGGVVTPASRVAKLGVGSTGGPPSHPLFGRRSLLARGVGQLVIRRIPAYRTAGQSKRARSGVSRTPNWNAGDARKHHGIALTERPKMRVCSRLPWWRSSLACLS